MVADGAMCFRLIGKAIPPSLLVLLAASGCSSLRGREERLPLTTALFDPRYVLQIETRRSVPEFQFQRGELVVFEGLLVYHGPPSEDVQDILPSATWFGSLYPFGEWIGEDQLRIRLRSTDGRAKESIDWRVDNDDFLLVLGDSPPPAHLVTSGEVCAYLRLAELFWFVEEDSSELFFELAPQGIEDVGLVRSELYLCK